MPPKAITLYGIGAAAALALARDGCDVAVTDLATGSLGATLVAVQATGGRAVPLALDLRDQASVEACLAGVPLVKPMVEIGRAEWEQTLAVNLTGAFLMSQAVGKHWIAAGRGGAIVSLSSTHGTVGFASPASAYVTGQVMLLDGALTAQ